MVELCKQREKYKKEKLKGALEVSFSPLPLFSPFSLPSFFSRSLNYKLKKLDLGPDHLVKVCSPLPLLSFLSSFPFPPLFFHLLTLFLQVGHKKERQWILSMVGVEGGREKRERGKERGEGKGKKRRGRMFIGIRRMRLIMTH